MIVHSEIVYDELQVDGRYSVRERHTDEDGREFFSDYMCSTDFDKAAKMQRNADMLNEQLLAEQEIVEEENAVG